VPARPDGHQLEERSLMRTLRRSTFALAILALSTGLAAGAAAQDEPTADESPAAGASPAAGTSPEGVTWILQQQAVDGPAVLERLPELVLASLSMVDEQAGGSAGCNAWFAAYELDGESLTFGPAGSTLRLCPPVQSAVEQAFLANIEAVATWASDGATLTLSDGEGHAIMAFDAAPEASVVGSWVAEGINNGAGGVETTALTPSVTAVFEDDGLLSGNDGCNNYFTSYEVEGEAITVAPEIASTLMLCADEALGTLSQQYFAALTAATTWAIDAGGALELRDDDGALQVRYVPAG
jgi:heat shock protein HslJ